MAITIGRIRVRLQVNLPKKAPAVARRQAVAAAEAKAPVLGTAGRPSWLPSVAASPGRPLRPGGVRHQMEKVFDTDFSDVRVHYDLAAGQKVLARKALAFTYGSDIYFAPGEYNPRSARGRALLAHELTHVIQNRRGPKRLHARFDIPEKASEAEKKALKVEKNFLRQPRIMDPRTIQEVRKVALPPGNRRTQKRWGVLELGMAKMLRIAAGNLGQARQKLDDHKPGRTKGLSFPKEVWPFLNRGRAGLISLFLRDRAVTPNVYFLARSQRYTRWRMPRYAPQRYEGFEERQAKVSALYNKAWKLWRHDRKRLAKLAHKPKKGLASHLRKRAKLARKGLMPNEILAFLQSLKKERKVYNEQLFVIRKKMTKARDQLKQAKLAWGRGQPREMQALLGKASANLQAVRGYDRRVGVLHFPGNLHELPKLSPRLNKIARWRGFDWPKQRLRFGKQLFKLEAGIRRHQRLGLTEPGRRKRRKLLARLGTAYARFHKQALPWFEFKGEMASARPGGWPEPAVEAKLKGAEDAVLEALLAVQKKTKATDVYRLSRDHHPWQRNRVTRNMHSFFMRLGVAHKGEIYLRMIEMRVRTVRQLRTQRSTKEGFKRLAEVSRLSKIEAGRRAGQTGEWWELRRGRGRPVPLLPKPEPWPLPPVDHLPPGVSVPGLRQTPEESKAAKGAWLKILGHGGNPGWIRREQLRQAARPDDRSPVRSQRRGDAWLLGMLERGARGEVWSGASPLDDMPTKLRKRLRFLSRLSRKQRRGLNKGQRRALSAREREQAGWLETLESMGIDGSFFAERYAMGGLHRKAISTLAIDRHIAAATAALDLGKPQSGALVLDHASRDKLKKHLGIDPGDVRVSVGRDAAKLAAELSAEALAVGKNVFLAEGKHREHDPKGMALIAHEVTHTLQTEQTGMARQAGLVAPVDNVQSREAIAESIEARVERQERSRRYAAAKRRMVMRDGRLEHGAQVRKLDRGPVLPSHRRAGPRAETRDVISRVMEDYSIKASISSRDFIDEMATRVMDLLASDLVTEATRREELEWGPFHRGQ